MGTCLSDDRKRYRRQYKNHDIDTPQFTFKNTSIYCRVVDVYDGDTIKIVILHKGNYCKLKIRLYGIDTPEITSANLLLKNKAFAARTRLFELITGHNLFLNKKEVIEYFKKNIIIIYVDLLDFDKYGRTLGVCYEHKESTKSFNQILIDENLAVTYMV